MLVAPKSQLRQVAIFITGGLIALLSVSAILFSSLQSAVSLLVMSNKLDSDGAAVLQLSIRDGFIFMAILAVCLVIYGAWISFRLAHKFYGPTVPILRQIGNIRDGNYASRIKLRQGDELVNVADALNLLAGDLEARLGTPASAAAPTSGLADSSAADSTSDPATGSKPSATD